LAQKVDKQVNLCYNKEYPMKLIQYRDMGMATYTYFYVDDNKHQVSPFFNNEKEALAWFDKVFDGLEEEDK
jgi:hypothetical protein